MTVSLRSIRERGAAPLGKGYLTGKLERLEENIGSVDIELTADELHTIEDLASKLTTHGNGYPEHLERLTGR